MNLQTVISSKITLRILKTEPKGFNSNSIININECISWNLLISPEQLNQMLSEHEVILKEVFITQIIWLLLKFLPMNSAYKRLKVKLNTKLIRQVSQTRIASLAEWQKYEYWVKNLLTIQSLTWQDHRQIWNESSNWKAFKSSKNE